MSKTPTIVQIRLLPLMAVLSQETAFIPPIRVAKTGAA